MRLEIIEKPSDINFRPAFFIWQDEDKYPDLGHIGVNRGNVADYNEEGVNYLDYKNPDILGKLTIFRIEKSFYSSQHFTNDEAPNPFTKLAISGGLPDNICAGRFYSGLLHHS